MHIIKSKKLLFRLLFSLLVIITICVRIIGIYNDSIHFTNRVAEIKYNIERVRPMLGSKFVINESNLKYGANWSYPIETILFSSYKSSNETVTICTDLDINFAQNKSSLLPNQYLLRRWDIYDIESLNKNYFMLDNLNYSILNIDVHTLPDPVDYPARKN